MSREGPGFIHVVRPTSAGHDTSSSNRSNSALGNVEHIRVGRGYVKVKTYENEASRGAARSPVSPTSPTSTQSPTVSGRTRKQKLLQLLKPKKNSLAGALSAEQELTPSIKRGEIRSWVDRQARERWDSTSQTDSEARTEFSDVRRDESDRDSALTPTISFVAPQPELSTSPYSDGSSSSIRTSISYDTSASFPRLSPLQNYMARNQEEQDADGRAYLDAVIGFERPTTVPEEEYLPQPQINNLSDPIPDPNEPATEIDRVSPTPRRPLPPIPTRTASQPAHQQVLPASDMAVAPPRDSQDAYAYVFDSNPGTPSQSRQSTLPPPPYATRYSAVLDRPDITREEIIAFQQQFQQQYGSELPPVAPLRISRR